jgi:hypothetical protein
MMSIREAGLTMVMGDELDGIGKNVVSSDQHVEWGLGQFDLRFLCQGSK